MGTLLSVSAEGISYLNQLNQAGFRSVRLLFRARPQRCLLWGRVPPLPGIQHSPPADCCGKVIGMDADAAGSQPTWRQLYVCLDL